MHIKLLLIIAFLLSGCSSSTQTPIKIDNSRSKQCQNSLKSAVQKLVGAKKLKVSNTIFYKTSYLHLTNKIANDLRGRKTLLLYKKEDKLYVGLIDSKENIIKEVEVVQCQNNLY